MNTVTATTNVYDDPTKFCRSCQTFFDEYQECDCFDSREEEDEYVKPGSETFQYLNAYEVTRHYGGPEEGGWWYNMGTPLASIPLKATSVIGHLDGCERCHNARRGMISRETGKPEKFCKHSFHIVIDNMENKESMIKYLQETLGCVNRGSIYSVLGGEELQISIEDHQAKVWPERRPRYE